MLPHCDALPILAAHAVTLTEADNEHPVLRAVLTVDGTRVAARRLPGAEVRWSVPAPGGERDVFRGLITRARLAGARCELTAHGPTVRRDLARRLRSFGGDPRPQPIPTLAGLAPLLD